MPVEYGLIGKTLTHSFSKAFFSEKFTQSGLTDHSYELFELESLNEFRELILNRPFLSGLNVTIPYKQEIINYLDELSPEAKTIGAVNTIQINRKNGSVHLTGYNTDAYGFEMSIKPFLEPQHQRALVLGNGGASKAVQYVLKKLGIDYLMICRKPQGKELPFNEINDLMVKHHRFVINTTPVGMSPHTNEILPFPFESVNQDHFFVDLIYNPKETLFLQQARAHQAKTLNGMSMLHLQAEKSFEIWKSNE